MIKDRKIIYYFFINMQKKLTKLLSVNKSKKIDSFFQKNSKNQVNFYIFIKKKFYFSIFFNNIYEKSSLKSFKAFPR